MPEAENEHLPEEERVRTPPLAASGPAPGPASGEPPTATEVDEDRLDRELAGLDALELAESPIPFWRRAWSATWPKFAAIGIAIFLWQCVVWSGWRPEFVLPGPVTVFKAFWNGIVDGTFWNGLSTTMRRAVIGYSMALVLGVLIGAVVSQVKVLRVAVGSLITGLQTMPSIAWFPLAIVLFKLTDAAIYFVVVLGAAPAIANGIISGADNVPPLLRRAGRVLGAGRVSLYLNVILPASLPAFISGMKQGWAFAWRSLLAGELLVIIARTTSIGVQLSQTREFAAYDEMMAVMLLILIIGIVVDSVFFGTMERVVRKKWGLDA